MGQVVSSSNVVSQLGQEPSPGTGTAAGTKLRSLMIAVTEEMTIREIGSQGHRFDTDTVTDKAWSSWDATMDALDYTEHLYLIENAFGTSAVTLEGTLTQKRSYNVPIIGSITPKTWIHQWGDPTDNVDQYVYGLLTDYGETWDRDSGVKLNGAKGIAQLVSTGNTFTATPKQLAQVPIGAADFNVYLDTTWAALGTTEITDEINVIDWSITGLKTERWAANRANPSFAGHLDTKPKATGKFTMYEGPIARPIMSNLKAGQTYFLRIDAQGPEIEAGTPNLYYQARRDFCIRLSKPGGWKDTKSAWSREVEFFIIEDPTSGNALQITSQTKEATL